MRRAAFKLGVVYRFMANNRDDVQIMAWEEELLSLQIMHQQLGQQPVHKDKKNLNDF